MPDLPFREFRNAAGALAAACMLCIAPPAAAQRATAATPSTYDALVDGMNCRQQTNGRLDCTYAIGASLRLSIVGVGQDDAVINFATVDSAAGWMAGFSVLHGCVVVRRGAARDSAVAPAFISPKDGRVYRGWQHCAQPPRR